jgi:ATP-dependent helicase/nuclease subunit A
MTHDQRRASDPEVSAWVGASAGTGKTHVLTARVLRLMLGGTPPNKILCLTFTKAAAAEMSNRIFKTLAGWTMADDGKLDAEIARLQGHKPDNDQSRLARRLFAEVLDIPGGLKVQTIHSFCQSLLGRFPLEAGEPPHFQVLDDRTAGEHLRAARDTVLMAARAAPTGEAAQALERISRRGTENAFAELVRELVGERARLDRLFKRFEVSKGLMIATRNALGVAPDATGASLLAASAADDAFDGAGLRQAVQALAQGSKTDIERSIVISDWLVADAAARVQGFQQYFSAYLKQDGQPLARLATKAVLDKNPRIFDILTREAARLADLSLNLKLLEVAENTAALLALARGLLKDYAHVKRRHAVLDYDDLILATRDLLTMPGIGPWVLYKLDGGIDHILIDEAQDTNPEQWQVVRALADEFFSGASGRDVKRTIFAVGDVKQSIYSFQRADPREFHENRLRFSAHAEAVEHEFRPVELNLSFRSTSLVLQFVDALFAAPEARSGLAFDETAIRHEAARLGHAGLIELWLPEIVDAAPEAEDWTPPIVQEGSSAPDARLAVRIAEKIAGWLAGGDMLPSRGRPIRAGDIMVLVRRRSAFVDYLIRALKQAGVPVAGSDRMVLTDQLAVMDLMALARFVLLPDDDLNLAVVLKGPLIGFDDDALFAWAYGRGSASLWASLRAHAGKNDAARAAYDYLAKLLAEADFVPPFEFFTGLLQQASAVRGFSGRQALVARLGEDVGDPVDEFLAQALKFEQSHAPSLQAFLSWLEAGEAEIKRDLDQGLDVVRIMTVHGAKGLQAPIVFLPDTTQVPNKGTRLLWAEDKEAPLVFWPAGSKNEVGICADARSLMKVERDEEQHRLLYVALTRAEDRLYVGGWQKKPKRDEGCWYDLIESAMSRVPDVAEVEENGFTLHRLETAQTAEPVTKDAALIADIVAVTAETSGELPGWATKPAPVEPLLQRPLSPSRPTEAEPPVQSPLLAIAARDSDNIRFRRGRLIHRLLQTLPDMAETARPGAASRYLSQPALALAADEVEAIAEEALKVMALPGLGPLFGPQSRAEVPIAGQVEGVAISGQVDRLAVTDHEVLIVDYKSNRPPPGRVEDTSPAYVKQMAAYQRILQIIYPGHKVICALLWTDGPALMTLPPAMLDCVTLAPTK